MENFLHLNMSAWFSELGYLGILFVIFAETGLFFGFFFPGDSLIFTAGVLASKGIFKIEFLVPGLILMAFLGYTLSYWIGLKLGFWLKKQKDHWWFKQRYLENAQQFYDQHGGKSLILGRFLPIIRTFVPIAAGVVKMKYSHFLFYNVIGALLWTGGITLIGYGVGNIFPNVEHLILPIVLGIIVISLLPSLWHFLKVNRP